MLGWMLKRGEHASDADAADTTQNPPDTPAPIFAARALKSALFGTPAPKAQEKADDSSNGQSRWGKKNRALQQPDQPTTPQSKPTGILLTPGTGTARRKRVSFDRDVPTVTKANFKLPKIKNSLLPRGGKSAPALEKSPNEAAARTSDPPLISDDEWEEDFEDEQDVTIDINEPHSHSGRYWKKEFERYRQESISEMAELLKKKQLTKTFAEKRDAEAIRLAQRLKDEQRRVMEMEQKIDKNAREIASKQRQSDDEPTELLNKLAEQTNLAEQYRRRVRDLEERLDELVKQREEKVGTPKRIQRQAVASPTTQKTLLETQRELRRARVQLRELESLREQNSMLQARLNPAEASSTPHGASDETAALSSLRATDLIAQLQQANTISREKDKEIQQLKSDFEALVADTVKHDADRNSVFNKVVRKEKIRRSKLRKEIRALKAVISGLEHRNELQIEPSSVKQAHDSASGARRDLRSHKHSSREADSLMDDSALQTQDGRTLRDKFRESSDDMEKRERYKGTEVAQPKWEAQMARLSSLEDQPRRRAKMEHIASTRATPRRRRAEVAKDVSEVDLLHDRFAHLGRPSTINSHANERKTNKLPPERRAAALARIQGRAQKERKSRWMGADKENVHP